MIILELGSKFPCLMLISGRLEVCDLRVIDKELLPSFYQLV